MKLEHKGPLRRWLSAQFQHLTKTKSKEITSGVFDTVIPGPVTTIAIDGQPLDLPNDVVCITISFSNSGTNV